MYYYYFIIVIISNESINRTNESINRMNEAILVVGGDYWWKWWWMNAWMNLHSWRDSFELFNSNCAQIIRNKRTGKLKPEDFAVAWKWHFTVPTSKLRFRFPVSRISKNFEMRWQKSWNVQKNSKIFETSRKKAPENFERALRQPLIVPLVFQLQYYST